MNVSFIYFDNDLDIAPAPDESFTHKPGDDFIMHWKHSPTPENYPYPHILLSSYNVRFVREIVYAHRVPISNTNPSTDKQTIPESIPVTTNPMATCPTEPWYPERSNNNIQDDTEPDSPTVDTTPLPPKLNEICICEDTPDPTCPIHRKEPHNDNPF